MYSDIWRWAYGSKQGITDRRATDAVQGLLRPQRMSAQWRLSQGSGAEKWCKGWQWWTSPYHQSNKATDMGICPPSHFWVPTTTSPSPASSIITLAWQISKEQKQYSSLSCPETHCDWTHWKEQSHRQTNPLCLPTTAHPSWWVLVERDPDT